jgi:hypothetical protein
VPNLIVSAVSTFDNRGLKKGQKEISAFDKTLKSLGKTFAGVFGAQKLLQFSKNAVNAFMADEKAAKALELQLKNTGFAFSAPSVEYYIANLQKTTGVLDDQLRPAFQQLLTVTGSVTQSQDALATALNISAATGKSVEAVSAALTRAYSGNTTGLSRLGAGISKATLKTGNMEKIMAELNQKFAGQSAARLDTYAGKMDILKVSAENASEIIGKGLLDSLQVLAKDNSIENAGSAMEDFATDIANATYGMALLIAKTKEFFNLQGTSKNLGGPLSFIPIIGPLLETAAKYGATESAKPKSNFTYELGASATKDIERANKLLKTKNKLEADAIAKLKAKSEVDKLKDKFDLERIGLTLALNQATDEETKLRLKAQLAILDNNEALAKKYNAELAASSAAKTLADSATNAANALNTLPSKYDAIFNSLANTFKTMGLDQGSAAGLAGASARLQAQADAFLAQMGQYAVPGGMPSSASTAAAAATPTIVPQVTVNTGAVLTNNQELERYIIDAVGNATKLGDRLVPRGAVPTFLLQ